jgi:hypothetical protein
MARGVDWSNKKKLCPKIVGKFFKLKKLVKLETKVGEVVSPETKVGENMTDSRLISSFKSEQSCGESCKIYNKSW